ncbi:hypothetical protein [Paenibacillus amylolyticus]|uniref:hypothetical protein n=1 Tax=Paenibacillus amylolyticus TaxID=1451 RepID=UPI003EB871B8
MESVSEIVQRQSIEAFQSVIRKSEKALKNMTEKGANTSLLEKRLQGLCVGLEALEQFWNSSTEQPKMTEELLAKIDFTEARHVVNDLLISLERMKEKAAAGTPQHTLLERRILAFHLAVQAMDQG